MTPAWRAFLLNKQKSRRIMAGYQGSVFHVPTLALSKSGKGSKRNYASSQPVFSSSPVNMNFVHGLL